MTDLSSTLHRVVIVGGGFGGLNAAQFLRKAPVEVTLLDKRNFHLFQPLLYQVATGGLSPANIAAPLRSIFKRQRNVRVLMAEVVGFDLASRCVKLAEGDDLPFDSLILAAGTSHNYFGHDDWAEQAPGLKTVEDATDIRRRILMAFEAAEREADPLRRKAWMTFVVVGGGPTGVEMAGAIAEIANHTLRYEFRSIHPADANVLLVEALPEILGFYPKSLQAKAEQSLTRLGVTVVKNRFVTAMDETTVTLKFGEDAERIPTRTVIWCAGVKGSPLGENLHAADPQIPLDRVGRVIVGPDCTVAGHPHIFVIGDLAHFVDQSTGQPLPGVAQVAIQQGQYAAKAITNRIGGKSVKPFRYKDLGNMATIGRRHAIAHIGRIKLSGTLGWMAWLFIHLMKLVSFHNRLLVFVQWAWSYFTWNRSARLITGDVHPFERPAIPPGTTSATRLLEKSEVPLAAADSATDAPRPPGEFARAEAEEGLRETAAAVPPLAESAVEPEPNHGEKSETSA